VEIPSRLRQRPLGILEEGDLGLVPAPRPRGAERDPPPVRGRAAPDGDVPPLVVAVARLRPDVRAGEADVGVGRDGEAGRYAERDDAGGGIGRRLDSDADRVAIRAGEGKDLER